MLKFARGLLVGCVGFAALTACSGQNAPPTPRADLRTAAVAALADAWVTDGRSGYFIDSPLSWAGGISPYHTRWNLRLLLARSIDGGLDSDSLARWLRPGLDGAPGRSNYPAITSVDHAVDIAVLAGTRFDRATALATVNALRRGNGYALDFKDAEASAAATATAVRIFRNLDLSPPDDVVEAARAKLRDGAADTATVDVAINDTIPALWTATAAEIPDARELAAIRSVFKMTLRVLGPTGRDPVWMAARADLREIGVALKVGPQPIDLTFCATMVTPDGKVRIPGTTQDDPQLTLAAFRLGCPGVDARAAPVRGRVGWPTTDAHLNALPTTAAGVRLARLVGVGQRYEAAARRTASTVWATATNKPLLSAPDLVRLKEITGSGSPSPHQSGQPTQRGWDAMSHLILLAEAPASQERAARARRIASSVSTEPTIIDAAVLELAARIIPDPGFHDRAAAVAAEQRISRGVYASRKADNDKEAEPSISASAIGVWIERSSVNVHEVWSHAGLCRSEVCAETPDTLNGTETPTLRDLAILLTCTARGCGDEFPLPI